jgi:hypothetical protein
MPPFIAPQYDDRPMLRGAKNTASVDIAACVAHAHQREARNTR